MNNLVLCKLLKKINTFSNSKEIVREVMSEILDLTDGQAASIYLLNGKTNKIKFFKTVFREKSQKISFKLENLTSVILDLLTNNYEQEEALDFMNRATSCNTIIEPFVYCGNVLGFILIIGKDNKFYDEKINAIQILTEIISSKLEILSLTEDATLKEKYRIEFLAGISHEFKTPLNSIIGFSDILKYSCQDSKTYRYIDNISKSSKFLLSLIQDILDLSRAQSRHLELQKQIFRPKPIIEDIILGFDEIKREKNIEISYTLTDAEINADLKRFKQLVYNLISNSIKFNRQNGKVIIVNYLNEHRDYVFEIKDTGDGISKNDSRRIFAFFTQVNSNRLKRQQGSGVGLALCKKIVEAHGGEINFKSKLNSGSRFWFTIPTKF